MINGSVFVILQFPFPAVGSWAFANAVNATKANPVKKSFVFIFNIFEQYSD